MTTGTRLWTGDDLYLYGPSEPCELVLGRVVVYPIAGALHGALQARLAFDLEIWVEPRRAGRTLIGAGMYTSRNPDTVRGPDILFGSFARWLGRFPEAYLEVAPELVAEVLSCDDTWQVIHQKLIEYFAGGVDRVWIVDPDRRAVLVYRSPTEATEYGETEILRGEGILEGFEIRVGDRFDV